MQRIIVDLPEPDGPQTTTFWPLLDLQVDVPQDVELAVPLVDVAQLDAGSAVRSRVGGHGGSGSPSAFVAVWSSRSSIWL